MREELFLEVFGDPGLDDDVVAVVLFSGQVSESTLQATPERKGLTSSQSHGNR